MHVTYLVQLATISTIKFMGAAIAVAGTHTYSGN